MPIKFAVFVAIAVTCVVSTTHGENIKKPELYAALDQVSRPSHAFNQRTGPAPKLNREQRLSVLHKAAQNAGARNRWRKTPGRVQSQLVTYFSFLTERDRSRFVIFRDLVARAQLSGKDGEIVENVPVLLALVAAVELLKERQDPALSPVIEGFLTAAAAETALLDFQIKKSLARSRGNPAETQELSAMVAISLLTSTSPYKQETVDAILTRAGAEIRFDVEAQTYLTNLMSDVQHWAITPSASNWTLVSGLLLGVIGTVTDYYQIQHGLALTAINASEAVAVVWAMAKMADATKPLWFPLGALAERFATRLLIHRRPKKTHILAIEAKQCLVFDPMAIPAI